MASIHLNLGGSNDVKPVVTQLSLADGRSFLALDLGPDVSIILPFFDMDAAAYVVTVANVLTNAALKIERTLHPRTEQEVAK